MNKFRDKLKSCKYIYMTVKILMYIYRSILNIPDIVMNSLYAVAYFNSLKLVVANHFTIGIRELANKKTVLPHPVGIVIGKYVRLGENCTIYQNVTIGAKNSIALPDDYPNIGNNVIIYANSVLVGNIIIGNNVIVGAGAVITKSIPDNSIVVGNPSRIIK